MDISAYFDVSLDWLIAGQKNKPKAQNPLNLIKEFNGDIPRGAKPFWNLQVSGGRKLVEMISNIMPVGYMEGIRIPGFEQTENIFPVVGYSMAPEVMENAVIGARQILNRWEILRTDKKHLIITNEERMIKYIQHDDNDENILWCVSPNYSKFKIYKDDILEIHQITFVMNPS
ncbi:hypothetical protein FHR24_001459 [Wenyingzhuangia heitensis]|uniref:HTH cro/C1-type domain-containing protein n=2 Tax=Wenyingzhuangia heitensis TaxID=1487859 RepID=A0ABX0UAP9_9FLAO|nr:hypothetical protein [Wenyingzhuangia heitensis]